MGEFNTPDSSWNIMNKWASKIKPDFSAETNALHSSNFSLEDIHYNNIKVEHEEAYPQHQTESCQSKDQEPDMVMIQEVDPLLVSCQPKRRRRGSGPKLETSEERAARLAKMSAYAAQRLANETPEQRALRLKRMSEYAAKRLSQETSDQRAKRLSRMSEYAARRLARETPEQRQARLTRMSEYAKRRRVNPTKQETSFEQALSTSASPDITKPDQKVLD